MSKYLALSLCVISLLAGIGIGFYISPQYLVMNDKNSTMKDLGNADRYFDLRYIDAMIAHHTGAMQLAEQVVNKTKRPEIKALAENILQNEPKLIQELYGWKKDWYKNTSKVANNPTINLGEYDENFDLRFINAAITHHQDGVEMAKVAATKSSRKEIVNNALIVSNFLQQSTTTLKEWRNTWYNLN